MALVSYEVVLDGRARLYRADKPSGALVWVHGGGFVAGDIDMPEAHWVSTALSESGISVLSVDYRLATAATRYPVPLDDVVAAWNWATANAPRLGIPATRIGLGGASAGANLAAGTIIRLLQGASGNLPESAILVYPTLHIIQPPVDGELRALLDRNPAADIFGPEVVRRMYVDYLADLSDVPPADAVPGTAPREILEQFPRTLVINAHTDELRISGRLFTEALKAASVPVTSLTIDGTIHGFLNTPELPAASAAITEIQSWLTRVGQ